MNIDVSNVSYAWLVSDLLMPYDYCVMHMYSRE
jgi:hypothetical protein